VLVLLEFVENFFISLGSPTQINVEKFTIKQVLTPAFMNPLLKYEI
jgi:hypothetical protein